MELVRKRCMRLTLFYKRHDFLDRQIHFPTFQGGVIEFWILEFKFWNGFPLPHLERWGKKYEMSFQRKNCRLLVNTASGQ